MERTTRKMKKEENGGRRGREGGITELFKFRKSDF